MALFTSGEIIERERQNGSLEPLVATPVALRATWLLAAALLLERLANIGRRTGSIEFAA